jgi:hypothetical protein
MDKSSFQKNQLFGEDGTLVSEEVLVSGVYLSLSRGVVGYSEKAGSAPSSVDFHLGADTQTVAMSEHPKASSVHYAEVSLPSTLPVLVAVQGERIKVFQSISVRAEWVEQEDGDAMILTDEAEASVRQAAISGADALNGGTPWGDLVSVQHPTTPVALVKQDLVSGVKNRWGNATTPVESGSVLAHDNALWRATAANSEEPSTASSSWTLIFDVSS